MFKLSLPVQRFVAASIFLMTLIVIGDASSDIFWNWYQNAYDVTATARSF
jgi:hypothetical protein